MDIEKSLNLVIQHFRAGNLVTAENLCQKILKKDQRNAEALHFLGVINHKKGQRDAAVEYIKRAVEVNPTFAEAYENLGNVLREQSRFKEAIGMYKTSLLLNQVNPQACLSLGIALQEEGEIDEAIEYYRKALDLGLSDAGIYNNLGLAMQKKRRWQAAQGYFEKALRIDSKKSLYYYNLANIFKDMNEYNKAILNYRKAIDFSPEFGEAYNNLGLILQKQRLFDQSEECYRKAIQINPQLDEAYNNLGNLLDEGGKSSDAKLCYQKAIQINPRSDEAYNNLGRLLNETGQITDAISCYQKTISLNPLHSAAYNNLGNALKDQGKPEEAEECFRQAIKIQPDFPSCRSNFLLLLNYMCRYDRQAIFSEHIRFAQEFAEPLYPSIVSHANSTSPNRRLKIGYISPDFRRHPVNYFFEPVLASHRHDQFEFFCYSDVRVPDNVTNRLQKYADQWRNVTGMSDEEISGIIRNDRIDILVDLAGHTGYNRMLTFARKPAPVQVTWLGYPNTTGLTTIDYRLIDNYTDPEGISEEFCTETLMRLPDIFLCYLPDKEYPEVERLPAGNSGRVTFGSFNHLAKVTTDVISLWSEILQFLPESRLIMKTRSFSDAATRDRIQGIFSGNGIAPERIELLPPVLSVREHLGLYHRIDIALDTFPYNGTTTTCEALWMGVPVITLAGDRHASRVGLSILSAIGVPEFAVRTTDEYIRVAVNLASDREKLLYLRGVLRNMVKSSPLTDARRFTVNLENCYQTIWKTWIKAR